MASPLVLLLAIKLAALPLAFSNVPWPISYALFFGPDLWFAYHLLVPSASSLVRTFTRFETTRREVWLTIDDGPDPDDTPRILALLARHQARATFFLIGERAARHPDLVAEIQRHGHEIAHHTHRHQPHRFWRLGPRTLHDELDTFPPISPAPRRFRPPVGIKNPFLSRALTERGLRCMTWSIRGHDTFARSPAAVAARVLRKLHPGAIILLHEGPALHPYVRVSALSRILEGIDDRGYRCVIPDDARLR